MRDDFNSFADDSSHQGASRAMDQLDAPLPSGDWAELGRQILAEAARRAIAEGASTLGNAGRDIGRCSRIATVSEDCA